MQPFVSDMYDIFNNNLKNGSLHSKLNIMFIHLELFNVSFMEAGGGGSLRDIEITHVLTYATPGMGAGVTAPEVSKVQRARYQVDDELIFDGLGVHRSTAICYTDHYNATY
jgi:hypothetical protein